MLANFIDKSKILKLLHSVNGILEQILLEVFAAVFICLLKRTISHWEMFGPNISDWVLSQDFFVSVITTNIHMMVLRKKTLAFKSQKNSKEKPWFVRQFKSLTF